MAARPVPVSFGGASHGAAVAAQAVAVVGAPRGAVLTPRANPVPRRRHGFHGRCARGCQRPHRDAGLRGGDGCGAQRRRHVQRHRATALLGAQRAAQRNPAPLPATRPHPQSRDGGLTATAAHHTPSALIIMHRPRHALTWPVTRRPRAGAGERQRGPARSRGGAARCGVHSPGDGWVARAGRWPFHVGRGDYERPRRHGGLHAAAVPGAGVWRPLLRLRPRRSAVRGRHQLFL